MRKSVASMLILATAAVSTSAVAADALSECYRTADNRLEVQACLKKELAETEKFYDDIVDRVLANARDLDRIQKRKGAAKAFEESNKAFAVIWTPNASGWRQVTVPVLVRVTLFLPAVSI